THAWGRQLLDLHALQTEAGLPVLTYVRFAAHRLFPAASRPPCCCWEKLPALCGMPAPVLAGIRYGGAQMPRATKPIHPWNWPAGQRIVGSLPPAVRPLSREMRHCFLSADTPPWLLPHARPRSQSHPSPHHQTPSRLSPITLAASLQDTANLASQRPGTWDGALLALLAISRTPAPRPDAGRRPGPMLTCAVLMRLNQTACPSLSRALSWLIPPLSAISLHVDVPDGLLSVVIPIAACPRELSRADLHFPPCEQLLGPRSCNSHFAPDLEPSFSSKGNPSFPTDSGRIRPRRDLVLTPAATAVAQDSGWHSSSPSFSELRSSKYTSSLP
ncbi:hypothetical protein TCAP_07261, partial [Tolypocladium capitatum]